MDASSRVATIIEPIIEDMGFELVRAKINNARLPLLQVMAEPVDGRNMDVEDCASLSRAISAVLDVEDPIASAYTLEVSSPGIDRPLTRPKDFDRWKGFEARVEMEDCVKDRKRFTGKLLGLTDGNNIEIKVDGEVYELPFDNLLRAKLLLSDELLQSVANEKQT